MPVATLSRPSASLAQSSKPLALLRGVGKLYTTPAGSFTALEGVDLEISAGDFLAVVGKSGSGKTTLANLLTGIDSATSGEVRSGDTLLTGKSEEQLTAWLDDTGFTLTRIVPLAPDSHAKGPSLFTARAVRSSR